MPRFASGRPAHTPSLLAGAQRAASHEHSRRYLRRHHMIQPGAGSGLDSAEATMRAAFQWLRRQRSASRRGILVAVALSILGVVVADNASAASKSTSGGATLALPKTSAEVAPFVAPMDDRQARALLTRRVAPTLASLSSQAPYDTARGGERPRFSGGNDESRFPMAASAKIGVQTRHSGRCSPEHVGRRRGRQRERREQVDIWRSYARLAEDIGGSRAFRGPDG